MYERGKTGRQGLCKLCMSVVRLVYVSFVLQWLGNYFDERSRTCSTYIAIKSMYACDSMRINA